MESRVIITGGAGFIGSHLAERLVADGHRVTIIDNLATGRVENLAGFADRVEFIQADVVELGEIRAKFKGCRWVFHLAGLADIVPSIERPGEYHRANVTGTLGVLEAAREAGVQKLVYAASSSCYGIPDAYPTSEMAEVRPMYPYALTKRVGEEYVMHWGRTYRMPVVSLRLFNVYGPRSRTTGAYGAVFGVFLAQKLAGKPLTVVGDGKQRRDFTFVTDVVDAFVKAAEWGGSGEIFNVGSGRAESVNRLVELIGGVGGEVRNIPRRPGEPEQTWADVSKIKRVLGWEAKVGFEEGVGIMLKNIGMWRDAPVWDEESIGRATAAWFKQLG